MGMIRANVAFRVVITARYEWKKAPLWGSKQ